jgi:alginate O-acetyltransferase complex protein AlgI
MLFNSLSYLVFFLTVLVVYWSLPWHTARLAWLLAMSCVFYAAWYPAYLILFVVMVIINYSAAVGIGRTKQEQPRKAKFILIATAILDLGNLAFFKYLDFAVQSLFGMWNVFARQPMQPPQYHIFLPLGISFYTFQLLGYVVDVYRGNYLPVRNPFKVALFKAFFAQLIAGPILRASQFIGQLGSKRSFKTGWFIQGMDLIAIGLFKKVLIADQISPFVDQIFSSPHGAGSGTLLLAVYGYAVQIYCDFSGYTDIGRGCAYCLGYELPINFRSPYFSCNIVEFWHRWHITLSNWLRDYLYIPLGGSRCSRERNYLNLLITMGLGGLWHGASWCFVVWGLLHGAALAVTRAVHEWAGVRPDRPLLPGLPYRILATISTFHIVCLGWIFFRAPDFATAFSILRGIFAFKLFTGADLASIGIVALGLMATVLIAASILHFGVTMAGQAKLQEKLVWSLARPFIFTLVIVGTLLFGSRGGAQFIYFQF